MRLPAETGIKECEQRALTENSHTMNLGHTQHLCLIKCPSITKDAAIIDSREDTMTNWIIGYIAHRCRGF